MPSRSERKAAQQLALAIEAAEQDAQKLFKQHEKERQNAELIDRADLDNEMFVGVLEDERLMKEKTLFVDIANRINESRLRVFEDNEKHQKWANVSAASWLPDVNSESEINAFLSCWREQEFPNIFPHKEKSLVQAKLREDLVGTHAERERNIFQELRMCEMARQLSENLLVELDDALVEQDFQKAAKLRQCLRHVYLQILRTLDKITLEHLQFNDMFFDASEIYRWSPPEVCEDGAPTERQVQLMELKYGLWSSHKTPEKRGQYGNLKMGAIGIHLDPIEGSTRMPRSLMGKANAALRCIQLKYDPFSAFCDPKMGQKYYALNCILMIEPLTGSGDLQHREYRIREDKPEAHAIRLAEGAEKVEGLLEEDIRVTFRIPEQVVLRHPGDPLIGLWNPERRIWQPLGENEVRCSIRSGSASFKTHYLSKMAIIQEKAFDIPYASWHLFPVSDDQVLFVIEGRDDRGERQVDREIRILVREHECRLFATDRPELTFLRDNWVSPATLLRRLAKAGYNFLLSNNDAEVANKDINYVPGEDGYDDADTIKPKSSELELRAYSDMATFCVAYAFSSSNHNSKIQIVKENDSLALFRISRGRRDEGGGSLECDLDKDSLWFGVRYERDRCVLGAFADSDQEPDLSAIPGKLTHLNLLMLLAAETENQQLIEGIAEYSSHLLQNSVFQLLALTRPLSWG